MDDKTSTTNTSLKEISESIKKKYLETNSKCRPCISNMEERLNYFFELAQFNQETYDELPNLPEVQECINHLIKNDKKKELTDFIENFLQCASVFNPDRLHDLCDVANTARGHLTKDLDDMNVSFFAFKNKNSTTNITFHSLVRILNTEPLKNKAHLMTTVLKVYGAHDCKRSISLYLGASNCEEIKSDHHIDKIMIMRLHTDNKNTKIYYTPLFTKDTDTKEVWKKAGYNVMLEISTYKIAMHFKSLIDERQNHNARPAKITIKPIETAFINDLSKPKITFNYQVTGDDILEDAEVEIDFNSTFEDWIVNNFSCLVKKRNVHIKSLAKEAHETIERMKTKKEKPQHDSYCSFTPETVNDDHKKDTTVDDPKIIEPLDNPEMSDFDFPSKEEMEQHTAKFIDLLEKFNAGT